MLDYGWFIWYTKAMNRLQKYAEKTIKHGVNLQLGDRLIIWHTHEEALLFANMLIDEAKKAGALEVLACFGDEIDNHKDEAYKLIWLYVPDLEAENHLKMPHIPWVLASFPSREWAVKVFSNAKDEDEALVLMWDALEKALRLDGDWQEHADNLQNKAQTLTKLDLKQLHFKNRLGTDLKIDLPSGEKWMSCTDKDAHGNIYLTNIPTEEVFASPLKASASGVVHATKPMVYMGEIIEGFWFRFEHGKVVEYQADKGLDALKSLLESDEGAKYLGEVALVPHFTHISQLGITWFDTSFDENASCHLALGYAYSSGDDVNKSTIHQDFMIGSECMDVMGITQNGESVVLLKNGEWV